MGFYTSVVTSTSLKSSGVSSSVADSGGAVVVGSALDLASGKLGWGMTNSTGLNGGMFVFGLVGVLIGSGDQATELRWEYNFITKPNNGIRLIHFENATNLVTGGGNVPIIKNAFARGRQLLNSSLNDFNCKRRYGGQVLTAVKGENVSHQRDYSCDVEGVPYVRVSAQIIGINNGLAKEDGMLGRAVTIVEIGTKNTPGIMSLIRNKIPEGWYAVYPSEKDGKKVVMVVTKDREMAFDPPPDPFKPAPQQPAVQ
jgi:hypothetical protein